MSAAPKASSAGRRAVMTAAATAVALMAAVVPAAAASPAAAPSPGTALATDQAEATQLATQIRVEGQQLEQLSEQADAATIHLNQVQASLAAAKTRAAATDRALAAARSLLTEEALDAYTDGGHASLAPVSNGADAADPSLVGAYGEIVAGTQRDAITTYRILRHQQSVEQAQLTAAVKDAQDAATQLRTDRDAAATAASTQRATLAGIQGRMAVLVAAAQAAQAQATADQEKAALAAQGQLPAATPAVVTAAPAHTAAPLSVPAATAPAGPRPNAPASPSTPAAPNTQVTLTSPPTTTAAPAPTTTTTVPVSGLPPVNTSQAQTAIAYARAQLGAPYVWGGAGPYAAGFDCSGLVMRAYESAGVDFPHFAQYQYDMTARVPISQLQPGDLVFFGTPSDVGHVGIYIGGGDMIDAPATGQDVSIQNIYWSDLLSGGRVS